MRSSSAPSSVGSRSNRPQVELPIEVSDLRPDDPVDRLIGIGPKTAAALASIGIDRVIDLVLQLPKRYEDRGSVVSLAEAWATDGPVLLRGRLSCTRSRRVRGRLHIADGHFEDETGTIPVRWFNQPWIPERLGEGLEAFVFGRIGQGKQGRAQLVNPEMEMVSAELNPEAIHPVYGKVGPLGGKRLRRCLNQATVCAAIIEDPLTEGFRNACDLMELGDALAEIHQPGSPTGSDRREYVEALNSCRSRAHRRLAFDEMLTVASVVIGHRARRLDQISSPIRVRATFQRDVRAFFPFRFTAAQDRVVAEILGDMARTVPMARLLQGDVGSGKTAVATTAILAALAAGRQAVLMAPTELLAEQLHRSVSEALEPTGLAIELLTGTVPAARGREIRGRLANGDLKVAVGTHALFQEKVAYDDLGLVVIDEQHRFGVAQRQRLLDKGHAPHLLVMTATPIPRSLALTLYGDLEVSVIDELPPGRQPVRTEVRDPSARGRIHTFLRSEIESGGQVFVVCPLIDSTDEINAVSLEDMSNILAGGLGELEVGVLHGRLPREEQECVARRFREGELKVLLATTVIEVGVDVPAASVMVVESADRFGLSQLHQLRGRVGRGDRQSWCILVTGDRPTEDARRRLEVLEQTTDGFEIAEADLRHRGPGELTGLRQWGADSFRFADLVRDQDLVAETRKLAQQLAENGELDEVREKLLRLHPVGEIFAVG